MCLMLAVDDDDLVREAVAMILASRGHEIIHARDGLEALTVFNAKFHEIHLVLMDIIMPKLDGIAATRAIKDVHPSAKVILMSGYADQICPAEADAFLPGSRSPGLPVEGGPLAPMLPGGQWQGSASNPGVPSQQPRRGSLG